MEIIQHIENNIDINFNKAVPLGLILNELLTNAYKHAGNNNESIVSIVVKEKESKLFLSVSDNGNGFPIDFDIYKINSYGLKFVNGLTQQLNGRVKFSNNGGASVEIEVPLQK
jgi:two-component sensor histidine kinase